MTTLTLNVVTAALQLSLLSDAQTAVLAAAVALDLLLVGVSALKAALDAGALLRAVRKRCELLLASSEAVVIDARTITSLERVEGMDTSLLGLGDDLELDDFQSPPACTVDVRQLVTNGVPNSIVSPLALAYAAMGSTGELPWEEDMPTSLMTL